MKNKNLLFKFGLTSFSVLCLGLSFVSATNFKLNLPKVEDDYEVGYMGYKSNNIVPVHFADNGNDFGGFMYITDLGIEDESEEDSEGNLVIKDVYRVSGVDVDGGEKAYECENHVKGFYYNSERGERLWPLDTETAKTWKSMQGDLITDGGIYTNCRPAEYSQRLCECEGGVYNEDDRKCECEGEKIEVEGQMVCKTEELSQCEGEDCPEHEILDSKACVENLRKTMAAKFVFYGQVRHEYKGQTFGFIVGADYADNGEGNWYSVGASNGKVVLADTFLIAFQKVPMGFVYDYNGGLGFAGCEVKQDVVGNNPRNILSHLKQVINGGMDSIKKVFTYSDTDGMNPKQPEDSSLPDLRGEVECKNIGVAGNSLIKVIIEGLVGMNEENADLSVMGTEYDSKMQFFSSSINNSTLIDYVRAKAEEKCRGKWKSLGDIQSVDAGNVNTKFPGNEVCVNLGNGTITADESLVIKNAGKTLVAKNGNVIINPFTSEEAGGSTKYDIFISNGDLIVNEADDSQKFVFTTKGFIANSKENPANFMDMSEFIKEFENGVESQGFYMGDLSGVGSFIRGNFIVDGRIKGVNGKLNNKYFIHGKITTQDSLDDLKNTFIWKCVGGYVKDKTGKVLTSQGKYCPLSVQKKDLPNAPIEGGLAWINPYESASLVVIDQNYDSPLYW